MPSPLAQTIRNEVRALQQAAARARRAAGLARQGSDDQEFLWDSVALNLAALYAGVQRTLRRVADVVDGEAPEGSHADAELFRQMAVERPGVRLPVLSEDTVEALGELRHLWRLVVDGRSSELDAPRLAAAVEALEGVVCRLRDEVLRFVTFLERPEQESEKPTRTADRKSSVGHASAGQDQRGLDPIIKSLMEELAAGLGGIYGGRLRGVYLFGSRARGDAGPDSDVDVLIVLDRVTSYGAEIDRTGQLVADLSLKYGVSVSRVFTSEQDWAEGRGAFLARLRVEAIPVVPVELPYAYPGGRTMQGSTRSPSAGGWCPVSGTPFAPESDPEKCPPRR